MVTACYGAVVSTYYYFHCTKHRLSGGCFTRQAWGAGNADLIDTFKFVMYHVLECGPENIGLHSEHEDDDWANISVDDDVRRQHLRDTEHIFPHSDDWDFMDRLLPGTNMKQAWLSAEMAKLDNPT
jgi:hypothetical protein